MSRTVTTKAHVVREEVPTKDTSFHRVDRPKSTDMQTGSLERICSSHSLLAEIKGLGTLKDGAYSVDFDNTVENMAHIISNMESQLDQVLSLNAVLKNDLNSCKEIIVENKVEKARLEEAISQLQAQMPSKRELQMEIDQLVDDRSDAQNRIHALNATCTTLTENLSELRKQMAKLAIEKEEAVAEINYLESCQNGVREQNTSLQERINQLKQEKISYQTKVIALQEECQRAMEEKYALVSEIREAQEIIKELRPPGVGRGIQSRWPLS